MSTPSCLVVCIASSTSEWWTTPNARYALCSNIAVWISNQRACLEFYKTERAVRTASSEQVRQPIYRDATEEWRPYEPYLGPLKEALGPVVDVYPDAPAT